MGVPLGVLLGVDEALSTLAFRVLDRGVTFELRKFLTGVHALSEGTTLGPVLVRTLSSVLALVDAPVFGEAAKRGATYAVVLLRTGAFGVVTDFPTTRGFLAS